MKIKSQIKINMDENSKTKIGEFVYFEDVLLECRKSVSCCHGCYFHSISECPDKKCFSCIVSGRIYIKV